MYYYSNRVNYFKTLFFLYNVPFVKYAICEFKLYDT